jgi:hypothetical protein
VNDHRPTAKLDDATTLAAVIAAVEAYLEAEASERPAAEPSGRGRWKAAPWEVMRGSTVRALSPWRRL